MKAVVYERYGPPEVLELKDIDKPVPRDNEVLVKVHAASINSWDWDLLRGKPRLYRLLFGLTKPKYKIIGADIAGKVEAVGKNVKQFQPGDDVFGDQSGGNWGGFAEFVCAGENALISKPASMTFEQAAAIPQAAVLSLQGIFDYGKVQSGQQVLINGAGGGVGTFAIQMAKDRSAEVTAVDSSEKQTLMKKLGADHVIDYTKEDFTKNGWQYDLILDVVGLRALWDYTRALRPGGSYLMIGGKVSLIFQLLFLGPWISLFMKKKMRIVAHQPNKDLALIGQLFESGRVTPVIDTCYPLIDVPKAMRHLGEGHAKGKVIITMDDKG